MQRGLLDLCDAVIAEGGFDEATATLVGESRRLCLVRKHQGTMSYPAEELLLSIEIVLGIVLSTEHIANECVVCDLAKAARACVTNQRRIGTRESVDKLHKFFEAKTKGFTGDSCGGCGGFSMVWNGTCKKCVDCGATGGCS